MTTCPTCGNDECVYLLMPYDDAGYWVNGEPVTKAEYVAAERKARFFNRLGHPEEPATAAFVGATGTRGQTWRPE